MDCFADRIEALCSILYWPDAVLRRAVEPIIVFCNAYCVSPDSETPQWQFNAVVGATDILVLRGWLATHSVSPTGSMSCRLTPQTRHFVAGDAARSMKRVDGVCVDFDLGK